MKIEYAGGAGSNRAWSTGRSAPLDYVVKTVEVDVQSLAFGAHSSTANEQVTVVVKALGSSFLKTSHWPLAPL